MSTSEAQFRLRSFVRRGNATKSQERARLGFWPQYGLEVADGFINYEQTFARNAPCYLEIGFGSGQSLLAVARLQPEHDFIGVETHKPGVGALMLRLQAEKLSNVRIYYADVIDVLTQSIPDNSLDGVQIFFPDPWQKRRHHERRLIQPAFIKLLLTKLKPQGVLHIASDWEDYAKHISTVLTSEPALINLAQGPTARSSQRPVVTKFEQRAIKEGRQIWEFQFNKLSPT